MGLKETKVKRSRQAEILFPLLFGSISLSVIAFCTNFLSYLLYLAGEYPEYGRGSSLLLLFVMTAFFLLLYYFAKKGFERIVSAILVSGYALIAMYLASTWGVDLPQALLMYALTIILSGILLGSKVGILVTIIVACIQLIITWLQLEFIIDVSKFWKSNFVDYRDTLITSATLSIISIVSWLSNREIESSLRRAEASEQALKLERDQLEVRVVERTRELQKLQVEQIAHMYRFADLGKLAAGLMHELINPLTVVSLNLDALGAQTKRLMKLSTSKEYSSLKETLKRAAHATKHIERYVVATQQNIKNQAVQEHFRIRAELDNIRHIFTYRSKRQNVPITITCPKDLYLFGNPMKFSQLMSTLVSNALDAYGDDQRPTSSSPSSHSKPKARTITIVAFSSLTSTTISVTDYGIGIPKSDIPHVFDAFFTTKKHTNGTGIGLSIARDIAVEDFHGSLSARSSPSQGTTFTLTIPASQEAS